ncbi:MAG: hypothetical protein H6581_24670 [Bacteroidia bacterium]|nr:hypothetical protein [Bacteroidia bacterium]
MVSELDRIGLTELRCQVTEKLTGERLGTLRDFHINKLIEEYKVQVSDKTLKKILKHEIKEDYWPSEFGLDELVSKVLGYGNWVDFKHFLPRNFELKENETPEGPKVKHYSEAFGLQISWTRLVIPAIAIIGFVSCLFFLIFITLQPENNNFVNEKALIINSSGSQSPVIVTNQDVRLQFNNLKEDFRDSLATKNTK